MREIQIENLSLTPNDVVTLKLWRDQLAHKIASLKSGQCKAFGFNGPFCGPDLRELETQQSLLSKILDKLNEIH